MTWRSKSPVCCHRKPTCSTSAVATASSHIIYRVCRVRLWLGWTWAATPPLGLNIFRMTAATFPLKMRASTQCCSVRVKSCESWKSCNPVPEYVSHQTRLQDFQDLQDEA